MWHGWTSLENSDVYHQLLNEHVIPGIEAKINSGYLGFELLRRNHENEVEFVTIMTFESIQNVIEFQGEDYTRCYVPEAAQKILKRWDKHASHYEPLECSN